MTSKEALRKLKDECISPLEEGSGYNNWIIELYSTIKQDLKRLETLEKENKHLKFEKQDLKFNESIITKRCYKLKQENEELKQEIKELKEVLEYDK